MPTGLGTNRSQPEKLAMRLSSVPWWATSRSLPIVPWLLPTELRKGYGIHLGRSGRAAAAAAASLDARHPQQSPVVKRIAGRAFF
jgi:hypothetical protein